MYSFAKFNQTQKVRYFSVYTRTLMALFASHYLIVENSSTPTWTLMQGRYYHVTLIFSTLIALFLVYVVHRVSIFLDQKCNWFKHPIKRLLLQFTFGVIMVLGLDYLLIRFCFYLFDNDFGQSRFMVQEFPLIKWMIIFLNFLYWLGAVAPFLFMRNFYVQSRIAATAEGQYAPYLTGKLGHKVLRVRPDEIACLKCESAAGYIYLRDGRQCNMAYKAEELMQLLDPSLFFQTNRGVIYAFAVIESYRRANKEGLLILKPQFNLMCSKVISRERYQHFKRMFDNYLAALNSYCLALSWSVIAIP